VNDNLPSLSKLAPEGRTKDGCAGLCQVLARPGVAIPRDLVDLSSGCSGSCGCSAEKAGVGCKAIRVTIPIRTVSGLNVREHWRARAARVRKEREATAWTLAGKKPPQLPCTVSLTRVGPSNGLDDDNLPGSMKGVRDQIAQWLGIDDRSKLVTWRYDQRRAQGWSVEIEISQPVTGESK
jgi:hypothetical protein